MKNITRERLIDLTNQLNEIAQELMEASEAPVTSPNRQNLRDQRIAKHFNNLHKKIKK